MKKPLVSIIITAYNEEKTLDRVMKETKLELKNTPHEIIVVDDASSDKTSDIAKKNNADIVLVHKVNKGKGGAFQTGIHRAVGKYIIQIDGDYQFIPKEIPLLFSALQSGYAVVLGTRYEKESMIEDDSVNHLRLLGSYFLSFVTSIFAKQRITDVMAGFKGFSAHALKDIDPKTNHFGYEAEVVIKAAQKGYKIKNVPITYLRRAHGKTSVNSFKHGFLVLGTIFKTGFSLS